MTRARFLRLAVPTVSAALLFSDGGAAQQFRAGADAVVVDVLVTKNDRPQTGLKADTFTLMDSGVRQTISLSTLQSVPVHLQLVLDSSASVAGAPLDRLKAAAHAAVDSLRPTDQASLVTFSHNIARGTARTSNRLAVSKALDEVTAHGTTSLVDAVFAALAQPPDANVRTVVLLFTDGDDTASWLSPSDVVDMAQRTDAVIYSVNLPTIRTGKVAVESLTDWILAEPHLYRAGLLDVLSHETGGEAFHASGTTDLREIFVNVVSRFNARYVLSYAPTGVPASGWHPISVTVKDKGLTVTARRGYAR